MVRQHARLARAISIPDRWDEASSHGHDGVYVVREQRIRRILRRKAVSCTDGPKSHTWRSQRFAVFLCVRQTFVAMVRTAPLNSSMLP